MHSYAIPGAASSSNPISNPNTPNLEELSPHFLADVSQKLLEEGNAAKSEEVLKMALSKDPEHPLVLVALSSLLISKGQYVDALKFLDRVISKGCPEYPREFSDAQIIARRMIATHYKNLRMPNEAIGYLEPLASMNAPENPVAKDNYYKGIAMLGRMSYEVGRKDTAAKCEMIRSAKAVPVAYSRRIANMLPEQSEFLKSLNIGRSYNIDDNSGHDTDPCGWMDCKEEHDLFKRSKTSRKKIMDAINNSKERMRNLESRTFSCANAYFSIQGLAVLIANSNFLNCRGAYVFFICLIMLDLLIITFLSSVAWDYWDCTSKMKSNEILLKGKHESQDLLRKVIKKWASFVKLFSLIVLVALAIFVLLYIFFVTACVIRMTLDRKVC